jgi:hypothetical protein
VIVYNHLSQDKQSTITRQTITYHKTNNHLSQDKQSPITRDIYENVVLGWQVKLLVMARSLETPTLEVSIK